MGSQEAAPWHGHRAACPVLGTAMNQPRKGCRARKQPGRNSWRSLFSLQEERLNKKLERGGNKALSVPHAARRNSWAGIAAEIWHQSEFWWRRERAWLAWGSVMTEVWENRPDRRLPGTGMAPALPSSSGAFVTKAIFPRVTKLQVQEHLRSALCAALHVTASTQTWPPSSVTPIPSKAELGPSPGSRAGSVGQQQPPLCSLLWDQTPTTTLSSCGGVRPPFPAPRGSVHPGVNSGILKLFLTNHFSN